MKVFLSQKMNGVPEEEILKLRCHMESCLVQVYGSVDIIDNYHHDDAPENAGRLWYLGRSIQMMAEADLVVFCPGYEEAKGCLIEERVCLEYDIPAIYITDTNLNRNFSHELTILKEKDHEVN